MLKTYIISHHSQTTHSETVMVTELKTYIISHHSQTFVLPIVITAQLKTYIISHHSQTSFISNNHIFCLRPILFHIILKRAVDTQIAEDSLRPILFHIILKPLCEDFYPCSA